MNVRPLVWKDTQEVALYACGKCGTCHSPRVYFAPPERALRAAKDAAEQCCKPSICQECAVDISRGSTLCSACAASARLLRRKARALHVPASEYASGVLHREHEVLVEGRNAPEHVDDLDPDVTWAWGIRPATLPRLSADWLVENLDLAEDCYEGLDVAGLQEDLDAWVDAQNTAGWWEEDPDTIVLVTRSTP